MGQIVIRNQVPIYCNLAAIQTGGTKANTVLANGEIWLVDTTNANKTNGTGAYDAYIKGNGTTAAKNLVLNKLGGSGMSYEDTGAAIESAIVKRSLAYPVPSHDNDKIPTTQAVGTAIQDARSLITQEINSATSEIIESIPDAYTKTQVDSALATKQDTISATTISVDDNVGTPSGTVSFDSGILAFSFSNLKGVKGDKGEPGATGPRGERGATGDTGVTADASDLVVKHTIDTTVSYDETDIAGADAVQEVVNKIDGGFYV